MNLQDFIHGIRFRYLQPNTRLPGWLSRLCEQRIGWVQGLMENGNTVLSGIEPGREVALRKLSSVPKMSSLGIGVLINECVRRMPPDLAFVNVGVWHGYSLLAGMTKNEDKTCIGIDNFSEFGGPKKQFLQRFERLKSPRHTFIEAPWQEYFRSVHTGSIGVYFYDAEHDSGSQRSALEAAERFFVPGTILIVDDTNWKDPRQATEDFLRSRPGYRTLFDIGTSGNCHPTYWNGLLVIQKCS